MKFNLIAIPFIGLLFRVKGDDDDTAPNQLPAVYNIPPPEHCNFDKLSFHKFSSSIACQFIDVTAPPNAIVDTQVLMYDCKSVYDKTLYDDTNILASPEYRVQDPGLDDDESNYFDFYSSAQIDLLSSGFEGNLEVCFRTNLKDTSGEVMMYRSVRFNITISYDGDFIVPSFTTNEFKGIGDGVTTDTKTFGVTPCVCEALGNCIIGDAPTLSLGTNLLVCITTDVEGTNISGFASFVAKKDATPDYDIISSGLGIGYSENGFGSDSVMLGVRLPALFFEDTDKITITGSVVVSPAWSPPEDRRHLSTSRNLQGQSSENSEFVLVLSVDVAGNDSPLRLGATVSSAPGRVVLMICTIIFSVAALLI